MEKLYIVIPAYNEEDNIETVIRDWYPIVERAGDDSRLVIVDDGSKDRTYEIICDCSKSKPQLISLTKPNGGHGATILYGYKYALNQGADYVFQTDSDGQTLSSEFEQFWQLRDNFDMIIGHRNKREDGFGRVFVTNTLKMVIKVCFGVKVKDANTPYRLMKGNTLKEYITLVPENYFLTNVLISVIYELNNKKVIYMPITFKPRQGGVNSINLQKIVKIGCKAIKDFWNLRKRLCL